MLPASRASRSNHIYDLPFFFLYIYIGIQQISHVKSFICGSQVCYQVLWTAGEKIAMLHAKKNTCNIIKTFNHAQLGKES